MKAVLSIHLPHWSIDLRRRRQRRPRAASADPARHSPTPPPFILISHTRRNQDFIAACCPRAAAAGVAPGMSLTHARALLKGDLEIHPHQPHREHAALLALARWAMRFSPLVAPDPPDGLLLDVTGCHRLFGGYHALRRRVLTEIHRLGFTAQAAIAPTVGAAWATARFHPPQFTPFPSQGEGRGEGEDHVTLHSQDCAVITSLTTHQPPASAGGYQHAVIDASPRSHDRAIIDASTLTQPLTERERSRSTPSPSQGEGRGEGEDRVTLRSQDGAVITSLTTHQPPASAGGSQRTVIDASTLTQPLPERERSRALMELVADYPVAALRLDDATLHALGEVAIDRIGDLLRLRRAALVERFGLALIRRIDQLLGRVDEPIVPLRPVDPVRIEQLFAGPVVQFEAIVLAARRMITRLAAELIQRDEGALAVVLEAERFRAPVIRLLLRCSQPTADETHLWTLLRPRIEKIDLSAGVEKMTLHVTASDRLLHPQHTCWADDPDTQDRALAGEFGRLIDLLSARLGAEAVRRVETRETHAPEAAFVTRPVAEPPPLLPREPVLPDGDRPSILYDKPQPIDAVILTPDGPVVSVTLAGEHRRILTTVGPERIAGRWWMLDDTRMDVPQRDYFKLQDEHGQWWWVYRRVGHGGWFLHGEWS